jgi:hypothetical protein
MRRAWHMAFFSLWGVLLFEVLVENFLMSIVTAYPLATGVYRWSLVIGASSTLLALAYLAYAHYRCLMLTGKDLRFQNVVFFFIMGIIEFAIVYQFIYYLSLDSFQYPNAPITPDAVAVQHDLQARILTQINFIVFSACTAVAMPYPRITSASAIISLLNFFQIVGTLLIGALLVATFVQKSDPRASGRDKGLPRGHPDE